MQAHRQLFLTAAVLTLLGCSDSENVGSDDLLMDDSVALTEGSRWILKSYGSTDVTLAVDGAAFTFAFDYNAQTQIDGFFGFDGCNTFLSEQVMLDENNVMPVNGVNTDGLSCSNLQFAEYLQQLDYFYSVISDTFSHMVTDGQLVLLSAAGRSLTFSPCVPTDPESLDSNCEPV